MVRAYTSQNKVYSIMQWFLKSRITIVDAITKLELHHIITENTFFIYSCFPKKAFFIPSLRGRAARQPKSPNNQLVY